MAETKTTTTVEFPAEEFIKLVADQLFPGKNISLKFVIREVGGDPLDRFPGQNQVTSVKITYDGTP